LFSLTHLITRKEQLLLNSMAVVKQTKKPVKKQSKADAFELLLIKTKYLVYIPVVALVFASFAIMIWTLVNFGLGFDFANVTEKELLIGMISMIDAFLLAILTLMIAVSLHELYISPISEHAGVPDAFIIESLDELKEKLGKVVYMILLVTFFKQVIQYEFVNISELTLLALGILLIALSLYFVRDSKK